jgi:hypothetical protein
MIEVRADSGSFLRNWAARVFDQIQLAQMAAIEQCLIDFSMTAWRETEPPKDVLLICACEDGVVLMVQGDLGSWRTSTGLPHKPPKAWMPCPVPPS